MFVSSVLITFGIMFIAMVGMAIGYMLNDKPIAGTCGGLANYKERAADGTVVCGRCGKHFDEATGDGGEDKLQVQPG